MGQLKEILSIIPARGGSKRIERKNLKLILDKPLIFYSIDASKKSKFITKTILTSEDEEILEVAKSFGAKTIKRPKELAQDTSKTAPVVMDVVNQLEEQNYKPDYVVLLQPTSPQRDEKYIDCALEYFFNKEKEGYDSCFSAFSLGVTHAKWKIGFDNKLEPLYDHRKRPRWQDVTEHCPLISENGAFYVLTYKALKQTKDFIGLNPCAYITPKMIDIDTPEDFLRVEEIMKNDKKTFS